MRNFKIFFIFTIFVLFNILNNFINGEPRDIKFFENNKNKEGYYCDKSDGQEYCSCLKNGKKSENFHFPAGAPGCDKEFLKIAYMPMCGNEWYDFIKLCSLINFYDDKPFSASNYKNDPNNKFLVLIDGCTICPSGDAKITSLRITHFEKGGNIFSKCDDENEYNALIVDNLDIVVPKGDKVELKSSSFSLPAILTHRICDQIFSYTKPDNSYTNIYLHITHNCGGREDVKKVLLPDIKLEEKKFKYNVAEIRGLKVNLIKDEVEKYDWDDGIKGYKVNSQSPKSWEDPKVECWWKGTKDNC